MCVCVCVCQEMDYSATTLVRFRWIAERTRAASSAYLSSAQQHRDRHHVLLVRGRLGGGTPLARHALQRCTSHAPRTWSHKHTAVLHPTHQDVVRDRVCTVGLRNFVHLVDALQQGRDSWCKEREQGEHPATEAVRNTA